MAFRWMCRAMALGWLLLVVATSGCWKVPSNFCCETQADCDLHDVGITMCPSNQVCSTAEGSRNSCVPGAMVPCTDADDCTNPALPACVNNTCVACDADHGCGTPEAPTCDLARNVCGPCQVESDCAGFEETPHCSLTAGCVQCRPEAEATDCAAPAMPICDPDSSTCRPCQAHGECASGVCNLVGAARGTCLSDASIAYVAVNGADTALCTRAQKCRTITRALATLGDDRRTILLSAGEYGVAGADSNGAETIAITSSEVGGEDFVLLGQGAVGIGRATAGPLLQVSGTARVTLEGIRLHEALGADAGDGIRCVPQSGNKPTLILRQVTIDQNAGQGIDATECTVAIERSTIARNVGGGVSVTNGVFAITNSFIVRNGGTSALFGGLLLASTAAGANQLAFNTIADNLSVDGQAGGVQCAALGLDATSNNVWSNDSQLTTQVSGNCGWSYSNIGPQDPVQPGTQNISTDPEFVAPAQVNYHLQSGSDVRERGAPTTTLTVDFDGEPRVNGVPDIGADEVTP
jgi:hypothetical protein